MGDYSAGFTLETYGHPMESAVKRQVEWIDELVFPEGVGAALKLHLDAALSDATRCSPVQPSEDAKPVINGPSRCTRLHGAAGHMVAGARYFNYQ